MDYQLTNHHSAFSLVLITLNHQEEIKIENGSMVYHNGKISLTGQMNSHSRGFGGLLKAAASSVVSGESFFITTAKATAPEALIAISPKSIGQIKALNVGETQWCLNDGAFLACDNSVTYHMKRQSIRRALFGGTGGLFVMETSGSGMLLVNGFGDIIEIELDGSHPFVVDNYHVVAWEKRLSYQIKAASGIIGFTTGEGLVNEFTGKGKLLIQTRNISELANQIQPFIPTQRNQS